MPDTKLDTSVIRMNPDQSIFFENSYIVHTYETDQRGFAKPLALLNYLQAIAGDHAALLGVAVADLRKTGHTWVMSRLHLAMESYPRGGDTVRIKTWPAVRDNLFTVRDYRIFDKHDNLIGRATTSWAVLGLETRRLVKLSNVLPPYPLNPERALLDPFATLPVLEKSEHELRLPVLRGDLDLNHHVNNAVYAGWALETIPEGTEKSCQLADLEISFRAEALYGDNIVARVAEADEPGSYIHSIECERDGRELARLRTRWQPVQQMHHGN